MPPGADAQTRQLMDQMKDSFSSVAAPLPEEAVGPGARWEVKMPIKSQGMTIDQTATYELVSLEGERLTTKAPSPNTPPTRRSKTRRCRG